MANNLVLSHQYESNRVMRNTYWMLSATLIPTIAGAMVGHMTGVLQLLQASQLIFFIGALILAIGLIFVINMTRNSGWGIFWLLLFTGLMGFLLSPIISVTLGRSDGVALISIAAGGTASIFAVMAFLSTVIKRDISSWGKFLFIGVLGLIVAMVANMFLQLSALALTISTLAVVIFSAFLLYDLKQIVDGGETNYISATLAVYLDLINIFQHLLILLGMSSDD